MKKIDEMIEKAKRDIPQIDPAHVNAEAETTTFLDCREPDEVANGYIAGALRVPKGQVDLLIEGLILDKNENIIVYCAAGTRSLLVSNTLASLGYKSVSNMIGGFQKWKALGLPVETPDSRYGTLNRARYGAQLRIPELGEKGQLKLLAAKVLVIGAGGLGSPVALYLAAAGVGRLGIMDHDTVDESNLQRQILHTTDRIGVSKVDSAFLAIRTLNPEIQVDRIHARLSTDNAIDLIQKYDLVIDGTDNFETRYLINQACHRAGRVNVHGSVFQWQGQVSVFCSEQGPCYECLFQQPPDSDLALNCAEGGVLGAITGVVGSLMACEAIKILSGIGATYDRSLLTIDLRTGEFDRLSTAKDPLCPCCSVPRSESRFRSLDQVCRTGAS